MKLILDVKESKAAFILELLSNFSFVKTEPIADEVDQEAEILAGLEQSVREVKLIKEGKLKGIPVEDLFDEL